MSSAISFLLLTALLAVPLVVGTDLGGEELYVLYSDSDHPPPPRNLRITSISSTTARLEWDSIHEDNCTGYLLVHQSNLSSPLINSQPQNITSYVYIGLKPWVKYFFTVVAYNQSSDGSLHFGSPQTINATTKMSKPSVPEGLDLSSPNSSTIVVKWKPPKEANGNLVGYIVESLEKNDTTINVTFNTTENEAVISELKPYTEYQVSVRAYNVEDDKVLAGANITLSQRTDSDKPGTVTSLQVDAKTSRSISISWEMPNVTNGEISKYVVDWQANNTTDPASKVPSEERLTIEDLVPGTEYTISVTACTNGNEEYCGEKSPIVDWTDNEAPGEVSNLTVVTVTHHSIEIAWDRPEITNGPVSGYYVRLLEEIFITTKNNYTFETLLSWKDYNISVSAYNKDSRNESTLLVGPDTFLLQRTKPSAPGQVSNLTVVTVTNHSIEIAWDKPEITNGPVSGYSVRDWVEIFNTTVILNTTENTHVFEPLLPWMDYNISVSAYNKDSDDESTLLVGPDTFLLQRTKPSAPEYTKGIAFVKKSKTDIAFTAPRNLFNSNNGPLVEHIILVASGDGMGNVASMGYTRRNETEFKTWKEAKDSDEMYRTTPEGWLIENENDICKLDGEKFLCTAGAQNNCDNQEFCNGPLRKKTSYRIKIRGYTDGGWSETNVIEVETDVSSRVTSATASLALSFLFLFFVYN